jgi:aspartyl-tRNA(Asn)/glutamyl-tRNA(Gln) amidotransferase subunit B
MTYETVIGLEVHCQLAVASKLFSDAPADFGGEPNTRVAAVDLGLPGVLPVINARAVEVAVRAAVALEGEVREHTVFDRKNYFYPDLPKGYQISQYERPFCVGGRIPLGDGGHCGLVRIHLEEDAGKSTHTEHGSLVDLNRAGVALIEIVGKPELRSPRQAHDCLDQLKRILQYAEVSDCDMEKGSLRCDANISLRVPGAPLGTKVEIKNLNSFKMVERALGYEERRQAAVLAAGGRIAQETRLWNEERGETVPMRSKESAPDYRYFPDPDLPPLAIPRELVERVRREMPELPAARRARMAQQWALPGHDLDVLLADRRVADWFEALARACGDAKLASNWTMTEVLRVLGERGTGIEAFPISPARLAELIAALQRGQVNRAAAKKVFAHMLDHDASAAEAIAALGLLQISDAGELLAVVRRVIAENQKPAADFASGKAKALHGLLGLVMRATGGKANPALVEELLRRELAAR